MARFKDGDIIKCNYTDSKHFVEREIISVNEEVGVYMTCFLEDGNSVESSIKIIDACYFLK